MSSIENSSSTPRPSILLSDDAGNSKSGKSTRIAYAVFGLMPVIGTFIGLHHMYTAYTGEDEVDGWKVAKIATQIFSFLILPQVIFATALFVSSCAECLEDSDSSSEMDLTNAEDLFSISSNESSSMDGESWDAFFNTNPVMEPLNPSMPQARRKIII